MNPLEELIAKNAATADLGLMQALKDISKRLLNLEAHKLCPSCLGEAIALSTPCNHP